MFGFQEDGDDESEDQKTLELRNKLHAVREEIGKLVQLCKTINDVDIPQLSETLRKSRKEEEEIQVEIKPVS